jgi:hypothetical protein
LGTLIVRAVTPTSWSIIKPASRAPSISTMPSTDRAKSNACAVYADVVMKTPLRAFWPASAP